jgi:hypothetical protein
VGGVWHFLRSCLPRRATTFAYDKIMALTLRENLTVVRCEEKSEARQGLLATWCRGSWFLRVPYVDCIKSAISIG